MALSLRAQGRGFRPATMSASPGHFHTKQKGTEIKRTPWLSSSPPTNCINRATWNLSDSPGLTQSTHLDTEDDYHTGCPSLSHCQQQSFPGLLSPGLLYSTYRVYFGRYCYCPWTLISFQWSYAYMPTLLDYPGVSQIRHWSPALPHGSPNLPDKMDFWAFLCFSLKFSPFFFSKFELFYS